MTMCFLMIAFTVLFVLRPFLTPWRLYARGSVLRLQAATLLSRGTASLFCVLTLISHFGFTVCGGDFTLFLVNQDHHPLPLIP